MPEIEDYYPTNEPCAVCGKVGKNGMEPRFLFVVCKDHVHLSPVEVSKLTAPAWFC